MVINTYLANTGINLVVDLEADGLIFLLHSFHVLHVEGTAVHLHVVGLQLTGDLASGAQVAGVPGQAALAPLVQVYDLGALDTGREVLAAHHHAKVESAEGDATGAPAHVTLVPNTDGVVLVGRVHRGPVKVKALNGVEDLGVVLQAAPGCLQVVVVPVLRVALDLCNLEVPLVGAGGGEGHLSAGQRHRRRARQRRNELNRIASPGRNVDMGSSIQSTQLPLAASTEEPAGLAGRHYGHVVLRVAATLLVGRRQLELQEVHAHLANLLAHGNLDVA